MILAVSHRHPKSDLVTMTYAQSDTVVALLYGFFEPREMLCRASRLEIMACLRLVRCDSIRMR
jgi:hypothetical protein